MADTTKVIAEVTNSITRLAMVVVGIILLFRLWGLISKAADKLEEVLSEDPVKKAEEEEAAKADVYEGTYWDEYAQKHLDTTITCQSGDTKGCIRDALMNPIQFKFTMKNRDLEEVPLPIAVQDSKVDLGVSSNDFWMSKGSST